MDTASRPLGETQLSKLAMSASHACTIFTIVLHHNMLDRDSILEVGHRYGPLQELLCCPLQS